MNSPETTADTESSAVTTGDQRKMDAALKAKWVEALRSGEFNQCEGKLHEPDTGSYCCLGVFSRVAGIPIDDQGYSPDGYLTIREFLGQRTATLWHMNDGGRSFSEIAEYIEQNL